MASADVCVADPTAPSASAISELLSRPVRDQASGDGSQLVKTSLPILLPTPVSKQNKEKKFLLGKSGSVDELSPNN